MPVTLPMGHVDGSGLKEDSNGSSSMSMKDRIKEMSQKLGENSELAQNGATGIVNKDHGHATRCGVQKKPYERRIASAPLKLMQNLPSEEVKMKSPSGAVNQSGVNTFVNGLEKNVLKSATSDDVPSTTNTATSKKPLLPPKPGSFASASFRLPKSPPLRPSTFLSDSPCQPAAVSNDLPAGHSLNYLHHDVAACDSTEPSNLSNGTGKVPLSTTTTTMTKADKSAIRIAFLPGAGTASLGRQTAHRRAVSAQRPRVAPPPPPPTSMSSEPGSAPLTPLPAKSIKPTPGGTASENIDRKKTLPSLLQHDFRKALADSLKQRSNSERSLPISNGEGCLSVQSTAVLPDSENEISAMKPVVKLKTCSNAVTIDNNLNVLSKPSIVKNVKADIPKLQSCDNHASTSSSSSSNKQSKFKKLKSALSTPVFSGVVQQPINKNTETEMEFPAVDVNLEPSTSGEQCRWFHDDVDRNKAEERLHSHGKGGGFMVRKSSVPRPDRPFAMSVYNSSKVYHLEIRHKSNGAYALGIEKDSEDEFDTLEDLVEHYNQHPLHLVNPKLLLTCKDADDIRRKITPVKVLLSSSPLKM